MTITAIAIPAGVISVSALPVDYQWRGNWNQTTTYVINDKVFRGVSSWRAVAVNTNDDPAAGIPSGNWVLVALGLDPTTLNAAAATATNASSQAQASATAASASATLAAAQIAGAASYTTQAQAAATLSATSATQSQTAAGASLTSAGVSQAWSMQASGTVDGTNYSSLYNAGLSAASASASAASAVTSAGSATASAGYASNSAASAVTSANWAMQTSGTVDGTYYSARYYAQQAAASAAMAAAGHVVGPSSSTVGYVATFSTTDGTGLSSTAPSAFLDTNFGSTQGTILVRGASTWVAVGPGAAGQVLTSAGAGANPSFAASAFPVISIVAKTAAYLITAADKATMFDLTGSFALTLPAVSGASSSAPLYYHFRKRDGGGRCTVVPNGSDTFGNGATSLALYQEHATLVSFGGPWYTPPGGREKVVETGLVSVASGTALVTLNNPFTDGDVRDVDLIFPSYTPSVASYATLSLLQGGSPGAMSGVNAGTGALSVTSTRLTGNVSTLSRFRLLLLNIMSATANSVSLTGSSLLPSTPSSSLFDFALTSGAPLSGLTLGPSTGTMSAVYNVRIYRQ